MNQQKKILGVLPLVMINIIAIDNLPALPKAAQLGLSLVTYYVFAMLVFFIPVALVSTVFATHFPQKGGIYVWIRESLGEKSALLVIWIQWIYNVVWYPTQMTFVVSTLALLIDPNLSHQASFLVPTMLLLFWLFTAANALGMKWSSAFSTIGALLGTLLPIALIIILGIYWLIAEPTQYAISINMSSLLPEWRSDLLGYLPGIMFGLVGIEVSAYHADEVIDPVKTFPRAIFMSGLIIFLSMVLASLAIAIIVPIESLDIITGMVNAFSKVLDRQGLGIIRPIIISLILLGGSASVATWIIGPSKGVMIAAQDGLAPKMLAQTNRHGVPSSVLIIQAMIYSLLACFYVAVPEETNVVYMLLNALTAQLSLLVYVLLFIAYLKFYNQLNNRAAYHIPGGKITSTVIGIVGIIACLAGILTGFFVPAVIVGFSPLTFVTSLIAGIVIFVMIPFVYIMFNTQK